MEFWGVANGRVTLDPHFFNYPSLTFYLHFAVQVVAAAVGFVTGAWHSLAALRNSLEADPAPWIRLARWTTALIAVATIVPVYLGARRIAGVAGAAAAALLLALNPLHVAQSRFIGTDIPLAFGTAMALYYVVRLAAVRRGEEEATPGEGTQKERTLWRRAGLWIGLAASCKYPGFLIAPLLPLLLFVRRPSPATDDEGAAPLRPFPALREATVALGLAFVVTSPFVLFDLPDAIKAVAFERYHMMTGHFGASGQPAIGRYLTDMLPYALGWPGLVVLALGLWILALRSSSGRFVAIFAVAGLLAIGSWKVAADRYVLLVVPALAVVSGSALALAASRFLPGRRSLAAAGLVALLVAAPGLATAWREGTLRGKPLTREAAERWVLERVPRTALIAVENYSVESLADSLPLLVIPFDAVHPHVYDPAYSLPYYAPFEYVVLSSALYDRYLNRVGEFPAQAVFYDGIARDFDQVALFEPGREFVGPTVRVFRRKPGTARSDFTSISGAFYNDVTEKEPLARFLTSLGAVLAQGGKEDLALAAAEQAVSLAPDDPKSLTNMAALRAQRGDYLTALKTYQRALAIAPTDAVLHYNLGRLYQGKDLFNEAAASFLRALQYNPRLAEAYLSLAICQVQMNEFAAARGTLRRFLELFPNHPRAAQAREALRDLS